MKYFDRVKETSSTTGTGAFTLTGTSLGYVTWSSVLNIGDTAHYAAVSRASNEWEIGLGTYSGSNTLARTSVLSSSNAGSAVNFSAGTKDVFLTIPASYLNVSGIQAGASEPSGAEEGTLWIDTTVEASPKLKRYDASLASFVSLGIDSVTEALLSLSDVTTGDVSTTKHGFVPKAPNDTGMFLRGDGTWQTPPSGSTLQQTAAISLAQNASTTVTGKTVVAMYEETVGSNQVPTMTSDTAPSGTVSYSSQNGSSYAGYYAFDKNSSNQWMATAMPCWLKYDFGLAFTIASYTIDSRARTDLAPKTWVLEGSNDDSNWTTLDSRSNITSWSTINSYTIASPASYRYYRISVSVGISASFCTIDELTLNSAANYQLIIPRTDYTVGRSSVNGSQTLTIKKVKTGTTNYVIDYI